MTITDKLLEEMGVLKYAYDLNRATVYHSKSEKVWKTLHPRLDRELLSYLYDTTDEGTLYKRQKYLEKGLDAIFNTKDEKISSSVIQTIYDITTTSIEGSRGIISIYSVENVMENRMPDYLDNDTKCDLYALYIATAYIELERYNEALDKCDRALEINPNDVKALYNRACSNVKRGNIENALEDLKTAIKIDKEEYIQSAKEDEDFESIKNDERFIDLLDL